MFSNGSRYCSKFCPFINPLFKKAIFFKRITHPGTNNKTATQQTLRNTLWD